MNTLYCFYPANGFELTEIPRSLRGEVPRSVWGAAGAFPTASLIGGSGAAGVRLFSTAYIFQQIYITGFPLL